MLPIFAQNIKNKYKANIANAFLLTGNIGDYVNGRIYLRDYLNGYFLTHENDMAFANIICYDADSQGIGVGVKNKEKNYSFDEVISDMYVSKSKDERTAYIFFYPQYIFPAGDFIQQDDKHRIVALHKAMNSSAFVNSADIIIIVADTTSDINPIFLGNNSKMSVFNIELPSKRDRKAFIEMSLNDISIGNMEITVEEMANLTAGLQLIAIEDILLYATNQGSNGIINARMVMDRKKEVIQKEFGEIIEIFDTEGCSLKNFAGQEDIKAYFKDVVIDAIKYNDIDIIPKGVMLMGPPGTGKTYFSRCLAGDAGINFVEFKMSKILGKYVGESEKSMEKALSVFRALAPVGVFMDEIDQSMRRGDGDSNGVASNLFGMLLAEMSKPENRGKIIWLAATNYPNKVDEALKRAGRFDKKIPFFAPTKEERAKVFDLHINKSLKNGFTRGSDVNVNELADKTDKYTQAEIEAIVVKALELCKRKRKATGNLVITQELLLQALNYMISAQNDRITEMEDIALKECNDQEFIPEAFRERHKSLMSTGATSFGETNRTNNSR